MVLEKLWQVDRVEVVKELGAQIDRLEQQRRASHVGGSDSRKLLPRLHKDGQQRTLELIQNKLELLQTLNEKNIRLHQSINQP